MMNKKEAKEIIMAHSCCTYATNENNLCSLCPWSDGDCTNKPIHEETIVEAMSVLKGRDYMKTMKLDEIKISGAFTDSIPKEYKMKECRDNWNTYHKQDRWIVIDYDGYLIDGYIMYLVLKENGITETKVKISSRRKKRWFRKNTKDWDNPYYKNNLTTYVFGVHPNNKSKKEYVWRVPDSWEGWADDLKIGDKISVNTKDGVKPIIVTRIESLEESPVDMPVKKVCKKR